jgi:hypothetical protein
MARLASTSLEHDAPTIPDPYADLTQPTPPSCTSQSGSAGNGAYVNLNPGRFCTGFNFGNTATINLAPGAYYVDQQITLGNATTINGLGGVTIVVNGNYAFTFSNNAHINITAPTMGDYAGMAFVGPRNSTTAVTQTFANGGIFNIKGLVYFPSQNVEFDNNGATTAGGCTQVVANIIAVQNNVNLNNNCAGTGVQLLGSGMSYLVE